MSLRGVYILIVRGGTSREKNSSTNDPNQETIKGEGEATMSSTVSCPDGFRVVWFALVSQLSFG